MRNLHQIIETTALHNAISNSKDNPTVIDNSNRKINYFIPGPQQKSDKE